MQFQTDVVFSAERNATVALTDCKQILIFRSEFHDLPRKTNAYLRTDSPSDANTRIIRTLHKLLDCNNLCLTFIFPSCNKHRFGMRYCPFRGIKCTISHPETGETIGSNGHYQSTTSIYSNYGIGYIKRRNIPK